MYQLVLLRHGESTWNKENRFTGWTDVDLSVKGVDEANQAAISLKEGAIPSISQYTSVLKRAIRTLWITLDGMDLMWIPVIRSWRLTNAIMALSKDLTKLKLLLNTARNRCMHGAGVTMFVPRPTTDDPRFPGFDPRYQMCSKG